MATIGNSKNISSTISAPKTLTSTVQNQVGGVEATVDGEAKHVTATFSRQPGLTAAIRGQSSLSAGMHNATIVTGGVTDVKVDGESVVTGTVAEIDLTGKQDALPEGENDTYLHKNDTTGELEWVEGTGGGGEVKVKDVKVNGTSVVDENKIAQVGVPTKTSDLTNDSGFISAIDNHTLHFVDDKLCVNVTDNAEKDNTLPISSSGVHTIVGNIESILSTI